MAIDRLGQEVNIGDWCAITQHNEVYVGKVIKKANSVTIARNRIEADLMKINSKIWYGANSTPKELNGETISDWMKRVYNVDYKDYIKQTQSTYPLSFARDNKFIKITPTRDMELKYENITIEL